MSVREDQLRAALLEAREMIAEQDAVLQQLLSATTLQGRVVSMLSGRALISTGNGLVETLIPVSDVDGKNLLPLVKPGAMVRVLKDTMAIIDVLEPTSLVGNLVLVTHSISATEHEVDFGGTTRRITAAPDMKLPEVGDRVLVDDHCHVAYCNFGPDESKFSFQGSTGVSWNDIGGLHEAKNVLQEAVEMPFKYPELYKKYNKKQVKGVLLYGPPGCGKTMLAKATATAIANIHNKKDIDTGFIYVKGPEVLDKWVGNSEAIIRGLFARARKHAKKAGYPAVLFIDEADALLGKRGDRTSGAITTTVVPQFLSEMDGLTDNGCILLLATNRPDTLDSAVTRDGRIDLKARVSRPNQSEAEEIFKLYLKNSPLSSKLTLEEVVKEAASSLYNSKYKLYDLLSQQNPTTFTLGNLVNGAMVAGMVDKATTIALRREVLNSSNEGILLEDLHQAADDIFTQNLHLNHEEEVREFMENSGAKYTGIVKSPNL